MATENKWTNMDTKYAKIIPLMAHLSKLEKIRNYFQQPAVPTKHTYMAFLERPNGIGRISKKKYADGLDNILSCLIKKTKYKVTCQYGELVVVTQTKDDRGVLWNVHEPLS